MARRGTHPRAFVPAAPDEEAPDANGQEPAAGYAFADLAAEWQAGVKDGRRTGPEYAKGREAWREAFPTAPYHEALGNYQDPDEPDDAQATAAVCALVGASHGRAQGRTYAEDDMDRAYAAGQKHGHTLAWITGWMDACVEACCAKRVATVSPPRPEKALFAPRPAAGVRTVRMMFVPADDSHVTRPPDPPLAPRRDPCDLGPLIGTVNDALLTQGCVRLLRALR